MAGANGTAIGSILRLGSLVPERRPVEIERDGEMVILQGYVQGPRCPGLVQAEVASAENARLDILTSDADQGEKVGAWFGFMRTMLLAVVPGLGFDEADVLAGNREFALSVLRYLGFWEDDAKPTDEGNGETDEATPLTTASSLPTSTEHSDLTTT